MDCRGTAVYSSQGPSVDTGTAHRFRICLIFPLFDGLIEAPYPSGGLPEGSRPAALLPKQGMPAATVGCAGNFAQEQVALAFRSRHTPAGLISRWERDSALVRIVICFSGSSGAVAPFVAGLRVCERCRTTKVKCANFSSIPCATSFTRPRGRRQRLRSCATLRADPGAGVRHLTSVRG
jgi:hypothetical protein